MNKLLVSVITAALSVAPAFAAISPHMKDDLATLQRDGIAAGSTFGRHLLHKSRRVEQGSASATDFGFVADYSLKFLGCHHVTQWASEQEQEDQDDQDDQSEGGWNSLNNRIRSKGLVHYRLCPSDSCSNSAGVGCSSSYGEYVVDMASFLEVYIAWQMEANASACATTSATCASVCNGSSSAKCYQKCFKKHGVNTALCSKNGNGNSANSYSTDDGYAANANAYGNDQFDLETYLGCAEYEVSDDDGAEIAHYLGPYCANQGGDVNLGFFQDATCSIPSTYDVDYIEKRTGVEIPYTRTSLVATHCLACAATEDAAQGQQDYYNYDADGNANYYVNAEVNEKCSALYMTSGKCETNVDPEDQPYPEEGACTYLQGIQRLQDDGIMRSQRRRSKPAAVAIGVFTATAVLLGGYVVYLKGVIKRSSVDLAGARTALS